MPPLVSIIVPCFNAERWLAETLESALQQTWPTREVILVNDGSIDGSLAIARTFESRGVRVVDQPNRGAAAARNAGLQAARGDYVQFLDADDLLSPDKIEQQLKIAANSESETLFSGAWTRFEDDLTQCKFEPQPNWRDLTGVEFLQLHYEQGSMMHPAAWLAPRSMLERAGPWNENLSLNDDGEYFARVMLAAARINFCPHAKSYYRSNLSQSLSGRKDPAALTSLFRSVELTVGHLLGVDHSPRSRAAAAHAWKLTAFEVYPDRPDLAETAEGRAASFGGSNLPLPAGRKFLFASRIVGWRLAKRMLLRS